MRPSTRASDVRWLILRHLLSVRPIRGTRSVGVLESDTWLEYRLCHDILLEA